MIQALTKKICIAGIFLAGFLFLKPVSAQQFSGLQGSPYSPVINTANQPASGINMPYRWGLEIAGLNSFWNNNIISLSPAKMDWSQDSIDLTPYFITGKKKRWGSVQADVHLLNFLFRWPHKKNLVVGAGLNLHSRLYPDKLNYNYEDSLQTFSDFLKANTGAPQSIRIANQQWIELYLTASTIVLENRSEKLAVGATLKLLKGIGAIAGELRNVAVQVDPSSNNLSFIVSGSGRYGYSKNLEDLSDQQGNRGSIRSLTEGAPLSPGLDIGFTYTRKKPVYIAGIIRDDYTDYDWKVAAALTDFGRLKYPSGKESLIINGLKEDFNADYLQYLTNRAPSLEAFNDSLAQILDVRPWKGKFSVSLPTALRIQVDKDLGHHFYINAGLTLDMSFLNPGVDYKLRQLNTLMITPRWEIKRVGIYAPLYLNFHGAVMAGAAFRLGPLTAGVHDFGWLFSHKKSGGGYVALVIKSLFKKKADCPTF